MPDNRTEKWDLRFLELAEHVAGWSRDPSTKCGAVLVRHDKTVISLGFNGFPRHMHDHPWRYANREVKYQRVVHCEMNAILSAREPLHGATLYTWPFLTCDRCAVHVIQAGISRVVAPVAGADALARWGDAFQRTLDYYAECGVLVTQYPRKVSDGA
jgi:dCMP deaminase